HSSVAVDFYSRAAPVAVPAGLVGQSPTAACAAISQALLTCVDDPVANAPVGTPTNQVTKASPPSGTSVAPGTKVAVTYYATLAPVAAPNCVGKKTSAFNCTAAGVSVALQAQETGQAVDCNVTWGQSTAPGQPVAQGGTLVVYYGTDCLAKLYEFQHYPPDPGIYYLSTNRSPPSSNFTSSFMTVGSVYRNPRPGLSALIEYKDYAPDGAPPASKNKLDHFYYTTDANYHTSHPAWTRGQTVGYVFATNPGDASPVYAAGNGYTPEDNEWSFGDFSTLGARIVWYAAP
ncbi:MAG: PASTA domain-containing protein, partial [Actinomycetota bacterium]|nr:PASTA domain-containing protein [Actinomycetota bacterium]